jgi:hypothetical protein
MGLYAIPLEFDFYFFWSLLLYADLDSLFAGTK